MIYFRYTHLRFLLTAFLAASCFTIFAGDVYAEEGMPLDFNDAVQIMMQSNQLLNAAKQESEKTSYEINAARGLFFPKIDLMFTYTHLSGPIQMDFNPLKEAMIGLSSQAYAANAAANAGYAGDSSVISQYAEAFAAQAHANPELADSHFIETVQKQDFWMAAAAIRQPIFTGGKIIAANRAAEARHRVSHYKVAYTENFLISQLVQRYYGYSLALKVVDVRTEALEGIQKHAEDARAMFANGVISKAELLHAEVALTEANRELVRSKRDADTALAGLKNTLSTSGNVIPGSELFFADKIQPVEYFRQKALEKNPVLLQLTANRDLAHQGYMKELAGMSPDIFLFGSMNLYEHNLTRYAPDWFVGAGAKYTLFEGMKNYNEIRAAKATEKQVESALKKARLDINTLVEKNYNELINDVEQLKSFSTSLEFANEFLRVREKAFKEGFAASADVVDARLNLSKVTIEKLQAMYQFDLSLARLLEACGISNDFDAYRSTALNIE